MEDNLPNSIRRCASGIRDIAAELLPRSNTPIRAITFRFFTTVRAMPSAMRSPCVASVSSATSNFGSRSGSSTVISNSGWPRSRIRLRMRSSIVMPAEGTSAGMEVTMP